MSIKISSRKAKARKLQKWVCEQISNITGIPWGKDELIASREMGQSGVDVKLIGNAKRLFPFSVECKAQEKWDIHRFIRQAKDNQEENTDWLLFLKKNNNSPVVCFNNSSFYRRMGFSFNIFTKNNCIYEEKNWSVDKWIEKSKAIQKSRREKVSFWSVLVKRDMVDCDDWVIFVDAKRFFDSVGDSLIV